MMRSIKLLFLACSVCSGVSQAQTDSESLALMEPISSLFKGMNRGDSAMVHNVFTDHATMATIGKDKTGKVVLRRESSIAAFLKAVGTPHQEPWSEPIWDTRIEMDGEFAQVWTKYAFYVGNRFNHCGVDAFQLIRQNEGWKIFHLADTRHTENCNVPESISNTFK